MRFVLLDGALNALGDLLALAASAAGLVVAWVVSFVVAFALRRSRAPSRSFALFGGALGAANIAAGIKVIALARGEAGIQELFLVPGIVSVLVGIPVLIIGVTAVRKAYAVAAQSPRCPDCRKPALQQTGVIAGEASGGMFGLEGTEWRCSACGTITFRKRSA